MRSSPTRAPIKARASGALTAVAEAFEKAMAAEPPAEDEHIAVPPRQTFG
jgi:hypothetical protein